ncbi:MAG: DUF3052 domain-containing protein [Micropruina sp.]|uniref:DUF3052 domain-containing protein n=1 Tax=Micropruina sp. TaxID=2737536 RepID=UPI0039E4625D
MASTDGSASATEVAALGLSAGLAVQEIGWDDDVDEALRDAVMDAIDGDLLYESNEAVDVVLLWWRESDGDVVDGLVDALTDLSPTGYIWLLTPKVGRPDYVDPTDIAEGALTAGLALANPASVSPGWQAQKLVRPKGIRR